MEAALDRVVPWARRFGGTLDLAFASQWSTEGLPSPTHPTDELDRLWAEWAERAEAERVLLAGLVSKLPADVRGHGRILAGPPGDALADAAATYDLAVVVSHQRTGLSRLVNGSVASRIVRRSTAPVLVLGLGDPVPDPGQAMYLLAPIDGRDAGALPWLGKHLPHHRVEVAHARTDGAPIWVPGPPRTVFAPPPTDTLRQELGAITAAAGFPGVPLHVLEGDGHPGDRVAALGRTLGVDAIVLPTHGRTGMARALMGSVAERVVERAHCAVLVIPWTRHEG